MGTHGGEAITVEWPEELELTERLVMPAELAEIMDVDEREVLAWIESGELDVQRGEDGQPRVPIREHHERGPGIQTGLMFYSSPRDPQLLVSARAERRARERDVQIAACAAAGVDVDALTAALAQRLAAVAPPEVRIGASERGMISVLDVREDGVGGTGVDVALAVAAWEDDHRSPADRVRDAGQRLLEAAQDEIAEVTTDRWPQRGAGVLPEPHAQLSPDGAIVRLFYGAATDPALELAVLPITEALRS